MGWNLKKKLKKAVKKVTDLHTKPVKLAVAAHKEVLPAPVVSAVEKIEKPILKNSRRFGGFVKRAGRKGFKGAAGVSLLNTAAVPITHPKEHAIAGAVAGGAYYAGAAAGAGTDAAAGAGTYNAGATAAATVAEKSLTDKAAEFVAETVVMDKLARESNKPEKINYTDQDKITTANMGGMSLPGEFKITPAVAVMGGLSLVSLITALMNR